MSIDTEFYSELEFQVEILILPTHFVAHVLLNEHKASVTAGQELLASTFQQNQLDRINEMFWITITNGPKDLMKREKLGRLLSISVLFQIIFQVI